MSNRVEHQKRNQPTIEKWLYGFVVGVQQALDAERENRVKQKNSIRRAVTAHRLSFFVQLDSRVPH